MIICYNIKDTLPASKRDHLLVFLMIGAWIYFDIWIHHGGLRELVMGFSHNLLTFLDQTINQDGWWNRAGSLAPFQSAFTTPLQAKWMNKLVCCPAWSVAATPRETEKQFGCVFAAAPTVIPLGKWERCIVTVGQIKIEINTFNEPFIPGVNLSFLSRHRLRNLCTVLYS